MDLILTLVLFFISHVSRKKHDLNSVLADVVVTRYRQESDLNRYCNTFEKDIHMSM